MTLGQLLVQDRIELHEGRDITRVTDEIPQRTEYLCTSAICLQVLPPTTLAQLYSPKAVVLSNARRSSLQTDSNDSVHHTNLF